MPEEQTPGAPASAVQDPGQQAAPAAVAAPAVGAGPWEQDIRQAFTDPQEAARVDAFLRAKVQPRMTQIEQQAAVAENAKRLYEAFENDPAEAYAAVSRELYGDYADAALTALQTAIQAENQQVQQQVQQAEQQQAQLDPRVERMVLSWEQQENQRLYDIEMARIANDPANADINPNLMHTFVAAADPEQGNVFDQAVDLYRQDAALRAQAGAPPLGEAPAVGQAPPPVMGTGAGGATSATPTQKVYRGREGLDEAMDDFMAMQRANRQGPPVS